MPNVCAQKTHLVAMGFELFDDIDVDSDCNESGIQIKIISWKLYDAIKQIRVL